MSPNAEDPATNGAIFDLAVVGVSHRLTPIAIRERIAIGAADVNALSGQVRARLVGCEAVIVSTCNRLEIYLAGGGQKPGAAIQSILEEASGMERGALDLHLYTVAGRDALEHLCQLACGLDSMVIGETQILGQVKDAYRRSSEAGTAGRVTHRAFQTAFRVAKAVHTNVGLGRGRLSAASVAVERVRELFDDVKEKTALVLGAGEIAEAALVALHDAGIGHHLIANRSQANAAALAARVGGRVVELERLAEILPMADVIVASVACDAPIITRAMMVASQRARRGQPQLVLDLGLPRNVEASASELASVFLFDLDHLEEQVARNVAGRRAAIEKARALVASHLQEVERARETKEFAHIASSWQAAVDQVMAEEVPAALARMERADIDAKTLLERFAHRLTARLSHSLYRALSEAGEIGARVRAEQVNPDPAGADAPAEADLGA